MDPSQLPSMRSGFGSTENSNAERAGNDFVRTSMGLLRVFSEEAVKTAGEYAIANDRTSVSHEDMQKGLKYQARMFFQTVENFDGRVDEAARELLAGDDNEEESGEEGEEDEEGEEEGESEEEEEEEGEAGAAADAPAEEDDETSSLSSANSRATASTVTASPRMAASLAASVVSSALAPLDATAPPSSQAELEAEKVRCRAMARRVDAIVASWPMFRPEDPVLMMIKNAIDATDRARPREVEDLTDAPSSKKARAS